MAKKKSQKTNTCKDKKDMNKCHENCSDNKMDESSLNKSNL